VVSSVGACLPVLEFPGTDILAVWCGVVTRLPAARSAKVMGPTLAWAGVWQFLVTYPGFRQFVHVTSSLVTEMA
jgi:hypothetical protein